MAIVNPESSILSIVADEPPGGSDEGARSPGSSMSRRVVDTKGLPGSALVDFSSAQDGLALINSASCPDCSEEGTLLFTEDGGQSWQPSPSRP
jgi:photosystem II stability/assembly factor-like uncharacterized protein